MNSDNLIFSSKIDPQVEDICFNMLLQYLSDEDYDRVFVKHVAITTGEVLFFTEIDGSESIIRIRVEND